MRPCTCRDEPCTSRQHPVPTRREGDRDQMPPARLPTANRLMGVLDPADAAAAATAALAREGFTGDAVLVLSGGQDADRIDSLGNAGRVLARGRGVPPF